MDFNIFFKDNIYILFGILIYMLFNSGNHQKYSSRIIVIYSLLLFFYLTKSLKIVFMLGIFLFLFFFQFEVFIEDEYKHKLINNIFDKVIDCLYLLIFKYCFIFYLLLLFLISKVDFIELDITSLYYLTISIFVYLYIVLFISKSDFELNDFDTIIEKIFPEDFAKFIPIDDNKKSILIELEDKTYLYRTMSYNCLSFWIFIFKIRTMINLIINHKERKVYNPEYEQTFKEKFKSFINFIRRQIRGYSTLEMQLYRQVAVKDGYSKKFQRKISELIYSQILFKNLKKYFKRNYDIVSFERYKLFLIDRYLKFAPAFLGKRKYNNYYDFFGKRKVSDCDFLFYVLCLSGKLNKEDILNENGKIDIDLFGYKYNYYLWQFQIDDRQIIRTVQWFNKKIHK